VVVARDGNTVRLVSADRKAGELGLTRGLTLADARARVPHVTVHEHQPEADLDLLSQIADWCDRYTPVVAEDMPDGLLLEISGSAHLFGGEAMLLADLRNRLTTFGIFVRTAIAGTPGCARAIARFGKEGIIGPGEEGVASAPLSVAALELDADRTTTLRRAGLATIADLSRRPRKPLVARFGADLVERLSDILGETSRLIVPRRPLPEFRSERRFADPIGLAEDIVLAFDELTRKLCITLEEHGQGGRIFEATFFRADGATRRIRALSGRPLRDPKALARLFSTRLEALVDPLDPGFGFDMIRLAVLADEAVRPLQASFERGHGESEALGDLIDRLTARFGTKAVERFLPEESHIPERAARRLPAVSSRPASSDWPATQPGEPPLRPTLLFTPPQPVETVAEVPDGPPFRFRWRRALHEIARSEGPERIAAEWWRDREGKTRDYYRVEDTSGRRFWLFREGIYGRETGQASWYIHGLFP